jgi:hypothetical protein
VSLLVNLVVNLNRHRFSPGGVFFSHIQLISHQFAQLSLAASLFTSLNSRSET